MESIFPYIPNTTYEFVENNLNVIEFGKVHELASSFMFGREDIHR